VFASPGSIARAPVLNQRALQAFSTEGLLYGQVREVNQFVHGERTLADATEKSVTFFVGARQRNWQKREMLQENCCSVPAADELSATLDQLEGRQLKMKNTRFAAVEPTGQIRGHNLARLTALEVLLIEVFEETISRNPERAIRGHSQLR
jgi:hypothetical protein